MPAGSGSVTSQTLTPDAAGTLIVTATFDCQGGNGSDWGSSYTTQLYCIQSGTTTYGDAIPMSTTRGSQTLTGTFSVTGGAACEIGLYGAISGAVKSTYWNVQFLAELIKR